MDEFMRNIQSPGWLLLVVLVGLALNLVSSYLVRGLDGIAARLFSTWRHASERRQSSFESAVENLLSDPMGEIHLKLDMILLVLVGFFTVSVSVGFGLGHMRLPVSGKIFLPTLCSISLSNALISWTWGASNTRILGLSGTNISLGQQEMGSFGFPGM